MTGPNCPVHKDQPMVQLSTTNEWKYYCELCGRRYNDRLESNPASQA